MMSKFTPSPARRLPVVALIAAFGLAIAAPAAPAAEDRLTGLIETSEGEGNEQLAAIQVYLNRLSDYLFVLARYLNQALGTVDKVWRKE